MALLKHYKLHLEPDASRTVIRPFDPQYPEAFAKTEPSRAERIVDAVLAMGTDELASELKAIIDPLRERHRNLEQLVLRRYDEIAETVPAARKASDHAKLVIGGYFSEEYSFEAAALFNPSIVIHPRDENIHDGDVR